MFLGRTLDRGVFTEPHTYVVPNDDAAYERRMNGRAGIMDLLGILVVDSSILLEK